MISARTFLERFLGPVEESHGQHPELVLDCPVCGGRRKLAVNPRTGRWYCPRDDRGGRDLVGLVAWAQGVSRREVSAEARERADLVDLRQGDWSTASVEPEVKLPDGFVPVFDPVRRIWRMPAYLKQRGVGYRTAVRYGLGVCETGLCAGRVVLPVIHAGRLLTYTARLTTPGEPKYWHPPGISKAGVLYGLDQQACAEMVLLVEGPFDVLSAVQKGFPAVGLMGKRATIQQAAKLARAGIERVVVLLDGDAWESVYDVQRCLARKVGQVHVAYLPKHLDPDTTPGWALRALVERAERWTPWHLFLLRRGETALCGPWLRPDEVHRIVERRE